MIVSCWNRIQTRDPSPLCMYHAASFANVEQLKQGSRGRVMQCPRTTPPSHHLHWLHIGLKRYWKTLVTCTWMYSYAVSAHFSKPMHLITHSHLAFIQVEKSKSTWIRKCTRRRDKCSFLLSCLSGCPVDSAIGLCYTRAKTQQA
jgi:hypothetical protein